MSRAEAIVQQDRWVRVRSLALALHEAFEGPAGIGQELNCWHFAEEADSPRPDPEPGDTCWELAEAMVVELDSRHGR